MPRALLQTGIQMDIDADDYREEGISLSGMEPHVIEMVIVEHPVVHPFTGSVIIVNLLIFIGPSEYQGIEPDIPVEFCVNIAAIGRKGTLLPKWTEARFAAGKGASPFTGMLLFTVTPVDHTEASHAQRSAVFVNGNGVQDGSGPSPSGVEVNKKPDFPFLEESISGIVVMAKGSHLLITYYNQ